MTHASLFSGIGGAEIAATWMGWENLFHCEINPFGSRALEYWYPNSTSYEDITKTDFTPWRGRIDVLTGGFPCQPFSLAGSRKGADDDRYLWPQMLRAIREIQPAWVVGENVAGILTMVQPGDEVEVGSGSTLFGETDRKRVLLRQEYVVETICRDLEREGYEVQPFVIPACAVGAPHRRDRVWIVARRIASDPADTRSESLQCGREDRVHAAGITSYPDLNRQRERTYQQVPVTERQGTSDDCACSQDGITAHPDEHRSPSRTASIGTESGRQDQLPLAGERPVGSQRTDGLHGLPRNAAYTCSSRRFEQQPASQPEGQRLRSRIFAEELPALRWAGFPTAQPVICRGDDGIPGRLAGITFPRWRAESIKALGNAIVPQVMYEIFRAIEENDK